MASSLLGGRKQTTCAAHIWFYLDSSAEMEMGDISKTRNYLQSLQEISALNVRKQ